MAVAGVAAAVLLVVVSSPWLGRPSVPPSTALVVRPVGSLVEQVASNPSDEIVNRMIGVPQITSETLLKDVIDALDLARTDPRVKAVLLDLRRLGPSGFSKLRNVKDAILEFRRTGKKVIAYADHYTQGPYYLAAHADQVLLHEQGAFAIEGFGSFRSYYKEGLDRLGVDVHVFRVGEYKSAVEPFLRNDMSSEAREATLAVLGDLWSAWVRDIAVARNLEPDVVQAFVDEFPERVKAADGDLGELARDAGFVDGLVPRDGLRKRMIELVGEDRATKSFSQVTVTDYLRATGGKRQPRGANESVAVVVARGDILDGNHPPDAVGSESTGRLIRLARERADVKALVLRVDSPGGSAFASEIIRRECALTREAGKPVVVSMGSVAASGGYWIATASDEIWAEPQTITGSIGIFGLFVTIDRPLAKYLGVHVDGVGTTTIAGALRADRPLQPRVADAAQAVLNRGYEDFLARVAESRNLSRDEVDRLARGRVWSGEDAAAARLVDKLGGVSEAIRSAAERAKLVTSYRVDYLRPESSIRDRLLAYLTSVTSSERRIDDIGVAVADAGAPSTRPLVTSMIQDLKAAGNDARALLRWNDPSGLYVHCLCGETP